MDPIAPHAAAPPPPAEEAPSADFVRPMGVAPHPAPAPTPEPALVFVYGTLKRGQWNHDRFLRGAQCVEPRDAIADIALYDTPYGQVPVAHPQVGAQAVGEVYAVDAATLQMLDYLESNGSFYERVQRTTMQGHRAWIYLILPAFFTLQLRYVEGGEWFPRAPHLRDAGGPK